VPADGLQAHRRALEYWLRLLTGHGTPLHAIPPTIETVRPFLSNVGVHLPAEPRSARGDLSRPMYLASAAHAAAHLAAGSPRYAVGSLRAVQRATLGALEDARVERLAAQALPGLAALWRGFHVAAPDHGNEFRVLLARLARALADPAYQDPHPWVAKGRRLFGEGDPDSGAEPYSPQAMRRAASLLGNDIGQLRLQFNEKTYVVEPAYRDDNGWIWALEAEQAKLALVAAGSEGARPTPGEASQPDDDAPEREDAPAHARASGHVPDPERRAEALSMLARHQEWDRLIGAYRADWCTVLEAPAPRADAGEAEAVLQRQAGLVRRLQRALRNSRVEQPVRLHAQPDGDSLDLEAAIRSAIERRAGQPPERGAYRRTERRRRDLSVLLLADLSHSTLDPMGAGDTTVLQLIREACLLAGMTIDLVGDRCAVRGFNSSGRHAVHYMRFKDFDEPFDEACRARIAGMGGRLSTRMGAALRHATLELREQRSDRRLVIVLTDGEPHDIDVHDRGYLIEDARRAVQEAGRHGIAMFCVSLDPASDPWVGHIFGRHRYLNLDRIEALPEALPALFLKLTR
jgi:nitric oxide reductase NorD protein